MSDINKLLEKIRLVANGNQEIISCINKIIFLRNDTRRLYPHCPIKDCGYSLDVKYWCPTHGTLDENSIVWKGTDEP